MEILLTLMGYTGLSYALHDDPALVAAVAEKGQELLTTIFSTTAQMPGVGAMCLGDDMGFKTATMISPADLHRYVFPCQRRLAQISHAHNRWTARPSWSICARTRYYVMSRWW